MWIATSFREEHRQALDWLNESTGEKSHFFGIELQVVRIGDSPYAPLFDLVAEPNDWQKQVRASTQAGATGRKGALYLEFRRAFLDRVHAEHPDWTRARAVGPYNWFEMKSPLKGTFFSHSFAQNDRLRVELYIDTGEADKNLELLEHFRGAQEQIELAFGGELSWEELPGRRACRIAAYKDGDASILETQRHEEFIDWFLDAAARLRRALAAVPRPLERQPSRRARTQHDVVLR